MKKGYRYSEVEKASHIKAYQTSGLTKLEYSAANKISISTVNRWLDAGDDETVNEKTYKASSQWAELKHNKKEDQPIEIKSPTIRIEIGKIKLEISEEINGITLEEILKVVLKVC